MYKKMGGPQKKKFLVHLSQPLTSNLFVNKCKESGDTNLNGLFVCLFACLFVFGFAWARTT
jgi:hypothetical protein